MDNDNAKYKKMIKDTDTRLKNLIAKWVLRYDYFGFLFSLVRRKAEVGLPNPAAVAPTPQGALELLYNPILISATSDDDVNEILHHEGLHILNKHLSRVMRILADYPRNQHEKHMNLLNIASDCCVNHQGNIKSPLIIAGTPFRLSFPKDHNLEPDRMMEEYYYTLLERQRQQGEKNKGDSDDKDADSKNKKDDGSNPNNPQENDDKDNEGNGSSTGEGDRPDDEESDQNNGRGNGAGRNEDESTEDGGGNDSGGEQSNGRGGRTTPQEGKQNSDNPGRGVSDNSDLGNHQCWSADNITDPYATSRNLDTYARRIIRESAKNFQNNPKARGQMPGYIQDLIEAALKPAPIPYYEIIRQLVQGSKVGKYKRSLTHINRKRTYVFSLPNSIPRISPFPGRKRDMSFKIGCIIDTSGSQSPEDIIDSLSGCKNIIEKDRHCETTVLEVDTTIHHEYKLKRVADINFDVKGRGGTTLYPGLERCRELNVDVCMCFTDGYTENFNKMDRRLFPKRMIWVITPNGTDKSLNQTGYVVFLPERKNV
jgi:predicted metal-dependent peptidase